MEMKPTNLDYMCMYKPIYIYYLFIYNGPLKSLMNLDQRKLGWDTQYSCITMNIQMNRNNQNCIFQKVVKESTFTDQFFNLYLV